MVTGNSSIAVLILLKPWKKMAVKLRERRASYSGGRSEVGWERMH